MKGAIGLIWPAKRRIIRTKTDRDVQLICVKHGVLPTIMMPILSKFQQPNEYSAHTISTDDETCTRGSMAMSLTGGPSWFRRCA
eukprot:scaffold120557_cov37-Prasinocladus_malaysianus.AAC.1